MRTLTRNKIRIFYANYRDKIPFVDEYGNRTGEYKIRYWNPTEIMANVSSARGESTTRQFGEDVSYDRILVLDDPKCPITETSILWIDTLPTIEEDGSTKTPYDYIVKQVAVSLNSVSIAVSRVAVTAYPGVDDSFVDILDGGHGNVSIMSNHISLAEDGAGNVVLSVIEPPAETIPVGSKKVSVSG